MKLTSKSNPIVKETIALKEKKGRREHNCFLVEGEKMVKECRKSGMEIKRVIESESYVRMHGTDESIQVSDSIFKLISDEKTPQGIICSVRIPENTTDKPKSSCLILDGISDPGNMGTIIRTANAAGYTDLYLINCTDPYSPKSVRASMSGIFFVRLHFVSYEEAEEIFSDIPIIVADMGGENIFKFTPPKKYALAIGNEANGISDFIEKIAKYTIKIPMNSTQESLNAGVSAGIAMYILKQNQFI